MDIEVNTNDELRWRGTKISIRFWNSSIKADILEDGDARKIGLVSVKILNCHLKDNSH